MEEDIFFIICLTLIKGLGPYNLNKLLERIKSPKEAFLYISNKHEINKKEILREAYLIVESSKEKGIQIIKKIDQKYPERLRHFNDSPLLLFTKGDIGVLNNKIVIAIVGTRTPTPYGRRIAEEFGAKLSEFGAVIVSGLARGIDSHAHFGSLKVGGKTIAVLAGGLDKVYPPERKTMAEEIIRKGLLVSEMPPGIDPKPWFFLTRNRIISGISDAVVVVEAGEKSGALVTAKWALDQGRDVFAVPGPINSEMSKGPINLIKDGAYVADSPESVLEVLPNWMNIKSITEKIQENPNLSEDEALFLRAISQAGGDIEEASNILKWDFSKVLGLATRLEIRGLVEKQGPGIILPLININMDK